MNPQAQLCPNPECGARGSDGNIWIHSQKSRRYRCKCCRRTFTETAQTAFYGLKKAPALVVLVVMLLAYGCPVQAIVKAFGLDERTVWAWLARAGRQCQRLQAGLVEQHRLELGQIQADELKIKMRGGVLWVGMVMQVATRLWLGGAVSARRDQSLLKTVFGFAQRAGRGGELLVAVDGLNLYVQVIPQVFSRVWNWLEARWHGWSEVGIVQTMKQKGNQRGRIDRQIAQGDPFFIRRLIRQSQGKGGINSAYIERLNATFRARMACIVREGRCPLLQSPHLISWMWLVGTVYNWCTWHRSLALALPVSERRRFWLKRTPAIAARLTDHCWTVEEILRWKYPLHLQPPLF